MTNIWSTTISPYHEILFSLSLFLSLPRSLFIFTFKSLVLTLIHRPLKKNVLKILRFNEDEWKTTENQTRSSLDDILFE